MKPTLRSRKPVIESVKPKQSRVLLDPIHPKPEARNAPTPSKFPPNRVILRNSKHKDELKIPKIMTTQNLRKDQQSESDSQLLHNSGVTPRYDSQELGPEQCLEARDRRTIMRYEFKEKKFNIDREKARICEWLGEMHFRVVSTSFNMYLTNSLTFEEVKVHCCQNLLLNILTFLENLTKKGVMPHSKSGSLAMSNTKSKMVVPQSLNHLELTQVLKLINETVVKNLSYMQIKYPLTKDTKPNKALKNLLYKINNLGNDEHDMVMRSGVKFTLKKEGNYTPQIMKFLNVLITKQTEPCHVQAKNKEMTYFQFFYETIQTIFTSVYKPEYEVKEKQHDSKAQVEAVNMFANILSSGKIEEAADQFESKEAKEYKEKVMKYTHYKIGRKVSPSTDLYTQKQIQTQIFDVRNSSILRILTKWTEELEKKIVQCQQQILKRPFRFKKNTQYEYSKLNATQKNDLFQQTKRRAKDVQTFMDQLKQNYNQIESMISNHLQQSNQMRNIPRKQYKVGYFCSKIQVAASATMLEYLNRMIHILLMIPQELKKNHEEDEEYCDNLDINLVTFKISDLFRCKIKSREAEIIRIFREIKLISEKGSLFKIVRIKDRLNLGTRDILINVLFMNTFLCQIQLAVQEYVDAKQVTYDSFSHYLYELHRSRLGPIMQSACTWAQFDQRSKIFRNLMVDKSTEQSWQPIDHHCDREYMKINKYPFVCSLCERFYSSQQGLLQHRRCNLCKTYFQCSNCIYSRMDDREIASLVKLPEKMSIFVQDFKLWNYEPHNFHMPKFGILTSRKMKKPDLRFFQTIIYKYDVYVVQVLEGAKDSDDVRIDIIEKVVGNSTKKWKLVAEKYIIYEWTEKRSFNKTITPEAMIQAMEEERKKRHDEEKVKKDEKEKKRLELQLKRKERDGEDLEDQDKEENEEKDEKKKDKGQKGEKGQKAKMGKKRRNKDQDYEQSPEKIKESAQVQKKYEIYHETICKRSNYLKVRVIQKQTNFSIQNFVLGIYLKQSTIRNRLKQMNNSDILHRISFQKIQVLFVEDEYIHNELNNADNMNQAEKGELKQTMQRVSQVYMDNNFIHDVYFLQIMGSLKVAHLSNNLIKDLQPLKNVHSLTELIIENNQIQNLNGLQQKHQLIELNLNRNKLDSLQYFKEQNYDFKRLRYLYASDNEIQAFDGIQKLTTLVKLDLSFNIIEEITEIKDLKNLEELDLSCNKLTKIKKISQFQNLKKLYLNDNDIKKIPRSIQELIFLTNLEMSKNQIPKIEHLNIGALSKNLRVLNLSNNRISKMEGLDNLERLQVLNLSYNEIKEIGNYLDLVSLIKFDLSNNSIQEVDLEDTEKYLPCLKELYLNSNPLLNIDYNKQILSALSKYLKILKFTLKQQNETWIDNEESKSKLQKMNSLPEVRRQIISKKHISGL